MNRKHFRIFVVAIFAIVLLLWLMRPLENNAPQKMEETPVTVHSNKARNATFTDGRGNLDTPTTKTPSPAEERKAQVARGMEESKQLWNTPIEFYGKVVDENDQPVSNAKVDYSCNNLSTKGTSYYHTSSGAEGHFSISGVRGLVMSVHVSKDGYYSSKRDNDIYFYAGENVNFQPDRNNPVVFHLRKKGKTEHLTTWTGGPRPWISFAVARDGTPLGIAFNAGQKRVDPATADFVIECWTDDKGKRRGEKYDWHCRLTVPGWGIQEHNEEFPFLAPESGYETSAEINMSMSLETDWKDDVTRNYFVKLKNGTYGRITFGMVAGGDHFCIVEPYINPSGSRNLEFDPHGQNP